MTASKNRVEFRLCVPLWVQLASAVPVAFAAFATTALARALWKGFRLYRTSGGSATAAQAQYMLLTLAGVALLVVVLGLVTIVAAYRLPMRLRVQTKRGLVVLDDQTISFADRQTQQQIRWCSIRNVRVIRRGGVAVPPRIVVEAEDCVIEISPWVCERHGLLGEVVSRASLSKGHVTRFETLYVRQ